MDIVVRANKCSVRGQLHQRLSNMLWKCVHLCAHTVVKACKIAGVHAGTDGHGVLLVSQLPHRLACVGAPAELMHARVVVRTPALPQVVVHPDGAETWQL